MATIHDEVTVTASATSWMFLYEYARIGLDHAEESEQTARLTEKGVANVLKLMEQIADAAVPVILEAVKE